MIKAFIGAIAMLLVAGGGAVGPAIRARSGPAPLGAAGMSALPARAAAEGTNSTPGEFALPRIGFAGFTCNRGWEVQPFFDLGSAIATEAVTIRAGAVARRNFTFRAVGRFLGRRLVEEQFSRARELVMPSGRYRSVSFTIRQGTEAREVVATVRAEFVDGTFAVRGVRGRLGACYARRWSVRMDVRPY